MNMARRAAMTINIARWNNCIRPVSGTVFHTVKAIKRWYDLCGDVMDKISSGFCLSRSTIPTGTRIVICALPPLHHRMKRMPQ